MLCFDPSPKSTIPTRALSGEKSGKSVKVPIFFGQSCFYSRVCRVLVFACCDRSLSFHFVFALLGHSGAENLCAEEAALGALDNLLVDAHGRVVHDDGTGLVVDLGVNAGVADEVDDPLLTLVLAQAEARREIPVELRLVMILEYFSNGSIETYLMSIRWWILQYDSEMRWRAASRNCSEAETRKKSDLRISSASRRRR